MYKLALGFLLWSVAIVSHAQNQVDIEVSNLKNHAGQLILLVFDKANGFPTDSDQAIYRTTALAADDTVKLLVDHLPKGEYAFSIIHDENTNNLLDTNLLGIPKEGVCASKNAKSMFGPPSFEQAAFQLSKTPISFHLKLLYY
ncbi:DUF2141 domain-containing protein [Marinoscillum furvescens]|uniref:Uncharacterized protein (DUF2141 family) n=1 Tax=Marinoscillum furvescens DSM 4134 TaxID=1122208 RepID=A0A3D9L106_MARFU|nr:DUF2141 domain-containing protein [Marinoscillum furvescens]RED95258.1 uncharacterized protein (DUF2141 family) [Marinoscillum furvescens DSM 4134]